MRRTVTAIEARRKLGELLEGVHYRGDEITIERAGKVMAVLVPVEQYESMRRSREEMLRILERSWERNRDLTPEEADALALEVVRDVRSKTKPARKRQRRSA